MIEIHWVVVGLLFVLVFVCAGYYELKLESMENERRLEKEWSDRLNKINRFE